MNGIEGSPRKIFTLPDARQTINSRKKRVPMMNKQVNWLINVTLLFLLLAACGGSPITPTALQPSPLPTEPETKAASTPLAQTTPVEIEVWIHAGGEREVQKQILKQFAAQSNIQVKVVELPEATYGQQVAAAAEGAGIAGSLPCLLEFDGPNTYNYIWNNFLIPLDPYVSEAMKRDFLPSIIAQGTFQDGKLYSLGQFDAGLAIWGNKKYLDKAGVRLPTVAQPWSRAEFEEALEKLKAVPGVEYPLDLKMNYGIGEWFTYGFSPILQGFGADLIERQNYQSADGVLNGPQAMDALTMVQTWFKKGYVNAAPESDTDFVEGKTALSWVGFWTMTPYREALGNNLVLLPMPDFGQGPKTGMGSWNWGITTKCEHPEAAWEILDFMVAPDQILKMSEATGAVPARRSALERSELYRPGGLLHLYIEQIEAGFPVPRPITPAYPTISRAFATAFNNIAKGADVQSELDKAVQTIDRDIQEHNGYPFKK